MIWGFHIEGECVEGRILIASLFDVGIYSTHSNYDDEFIEAMVLVRIQCVFTVSYRKHKIVQRRAARCAALI